jgi:hypothetical protein
MPRRRHHTESRDQPQRAVAAKGSAVVHADDLGQAQAAKPPGQGGAHGGIALVGQQLNAQDETAVPIAHRQRLDPRAVAGAKPALEVHRPDLIGGAGLGEGLGLEDRAAPRPTRRRSHQLQTAQPARQRAYGGKSPDWRMPLTQPAPELFRSPMRRLLAGAPQPFLPAWRAGCRWPKRSARPILQRFETGGAAALPPLATGFTTEPELTTQAREAFVSRFHRPHESSACFQQLSFLPRQISPRRGHLGRETEVLPRS